MYFCPVVFFLYNVTVLKSIHGVMSIRRVLRIAELPSLYAIYLLIYLFRAGWPFLLFTVTRKAVVNEHEWLWLCFLFLLHKCLNVECLRDMADPCASFQDSAKSVYTFMYHLTLSGASLETSSYLYIFTTCRYCHLLICTILVYI